MSYEAASQCINGNDKKRLQLGMQMRSLCGDYYDDVHCMFVMVIYFQILNKSLLYNTIVVVLLLLVL